MKFQFGPVPENLDFNVEGDGWNKLKEPKASIMQICAIFIAIIVYFFFCKIYKYFNIYPRNLPVFLILIIFVFLIITHELLHTLCHPFFGLSKDTIIGFWPKQILFYAHYDKELKKGRFLFILIFPFLAISILPFIFYILFKIKLSFLTWFSLINALCSGGDILGFFLIFFQVPAKAKVRNKGYFTYWKKYF